MIQIKNFLTKEHGVASVMVGLSLAALMGMAALAVDLGRAYLKKSALQTAADAGALAGANSILAEGTDFATIRSIVSNYAYMNMQDADVPSAALTTTDIVFMKDGVPDTTDPNQIEVTITRSQARGNAFPMVFGKVIGIPTADLSVQARAGIVAACSSKCVKPFVVPTKFEWDDTAAPGTDYYENGTFDVESTEEIATLNVIGYGDTDIGTQIIIKPGDPSLSIAPGQYNLIDLPPSNKATPTPGAAMVRENIQGCTGSNSEYAVEAGDELLLEPGNSQGPVKQGVGDLISQDPDASWDSINNRIVGSDFSDPMDSPRVAIMAFYDPMYPPVSGRNSVIVYELGAFFLESVDALGNVTARFIHTGAVDPVVSTDDSCLLRISRVMLDSSRQ